MRPQPLLQMAIRVVRPEMVKPLRPQRLGMEKWLLMQEETRRLLRGGARSWLKVGVRRMKGHDEPDSVRAGACRMEVSRK